VTCGDSSGSGLLASTLHDYCTVQAFHNLIHGDIK